VNLDDGFETRLRAFGSKVPTSTLPRTAASVRTDHCSELPKVPHGPTDLHELLVGTLPPRRAAADVKERGGSGKTRWFSISSRRRLSHSSCADFDCGTRCYPKGDNLMFHVKH
jgi:hypothetical protein